MRPLKKFEEFLENGVVRKRKPDQSRADWLFREEEDRKKFLDEAYEKVGMRNDNANYFIENAYDTLIGLIRAQMLLQGFSASGEGAHEAEVAFLRKLKFTESETRFMNELRYFRNGILYYGKKFDVEYGKRVLEFLSKVYPRLKEK
ncbi:MAG: hypothetical protein KKA65_02735 [Nanoarchaeota archaeon]|nr:hypothetical protein [Nanoarchaeota archaeon]MBU4456394.1 hypothetical protein [Nanoarchaeota archaeon]